MYSRYSPVRAMEEEDIPQLMDVGLVPVTILTGWLGSGKTTLVSKSLEKLSAAGKRVAVIQNEGAGLGGLEKPVLSGDEGLLLQDFLELANGCICCTVKSVNRSSSCSNAFQKRLPLSNGAAFETQEV